MKVYTVAAAVIFHDNKILCTQRGSSKHEYISLKWEFPGGKIEKGESEANALFREIKEELNVEVEIHKKLVEVQHDYPDFRLIMYAFLCTLLTTSLVLNEHKAFKWLASSELNQLDWAAADLPIVNKLISNNIYEYL